RAAARRALVERRAERRMAEPSSPQCGARARAIQAPDEPSPVGLAGSREEEYSRCRLRQEPASGAEMVAPRRTRPMILIIGCGRLGSSLAVRLTAAGQEVTVLDHNTQNFDTNLPRDFSGRT